MPVQSKYSKELKLEICRKYVKDILGCTTLSKMYNIPLSNIKNWVQDYAVKGEKAFDQHSVKHYSAKLRLKIVKEYLTGNISMRNLAAKYNITHNVSVGTWVRKYRAGIPFKDYTINGVNATMKSNQTFFEERKRIILWYLDNGKNVLATSKQFTIPYETVRKWIRKYEKYGDEGLKNHPRGRSKKAPYYFEDIAEVDKLKLENRALKEKLKQQSLQIELLSKVKKKSGP